MPQKTLMHARQVFAITIGIATLCIHGLAFAQSGGSTPLHDFDGIGDVSSLRADRASYELVDGGRADRGQALRISFDAFSDTQDGSPGLVFEKSSMPKRDFSQIESLSFWVKNESDSSSYILISAQDLDGGRSWTSSDRLYVSPGGWRHVVYRLELQGLDRQRIGSLHLLHKSRRRGLSLFFDDFELLSPLASQLVLLEDRIRSSIENVQESAKQTGLEAFIAPDTERLMQRYRDASSLAASERLSALSQLAPEVANLAGTINYQRNNLTLRGGQVTDAWLAACAPKIADAEAVELMDTSITDAGLAHLRPLEHLQRLHLSSPGITGSGLKGFPGTKLRHLNFRESSGVNDVGLESISAFRHVEFINLSDTAVTDAGLRHLAGMKSLTFLLLQRTSITDEGLSHLRNLTALEYLYLGSTDVTSLADLGELTNLNTIELSETRVDDAGLAGLGAFPKLETLILSKTKVLGPGLAGLKNAMQLSTLKLNETRINDAALAGLLELPKLTRLEVSSTRITDATLVRITRAKRLVYGPHVTGDGTLAERLNYLDIYGTNVTGDGIRRLGALTGLRELYAGGTGADDASIAALGELGDLFRLDLQGTRITDASLETIGKFKNLNSLNLSGTAVTGSTLSKLSGIEELRTLNLAGTGTSNETLDTITQFLVRAVDSNGSGGGFAWLNKLILTDTEISDAGLKNLSRLKHLFALHLDGTKVGDKGLEQIALLPDLQDLWLDRTGVSDTGLAGLSNSHKLRTLSLKRTEITDEALTQIGGPIQELALSHTRVSDTGLRTLASKEQLQVLELAGTAVTDSGLETIAQLPNLRVIDLGATSISDLGVATLKTLPALYELRLDRTAITDQAAESLSLFEALGEVSLDGTRVTADGKALLGRKRPELAVELEFPWDDAVWAGGESSNETPWSSSSLPEDATVADLERLSAVRSLSLQHRSVDAETLVALRDLTDLESLDLADTSVDDGLLANLIGLPRLRALRLSRTAISDDGLQHLAGLQALEHLDLNGTYVTGVGLQYLKGLAALRSIRLSETLFRDEHAAQLASLESLRKISATNTRLGDAGLRELERLPALRYLDLFGTDVSDAGLESIGRMSSLSHLYLSATTVTDLGLAALVGLEDIVELGVDHSKITDRGLEHVTGFRHLERLRLNGTRISDVGVRTISAITSLRRLELNDTVISDSSVGDLLKLTALEELELNGTTLSDRGLGELESLGALERLSVRDTDVSASGIETFKVRRPDVELTFESEPSKFSWIGIALSILYGLIALAICLYGAHRYLLIWLFVRHRGVRSAQAPASTFSELPPVTIQIPLFNERNVAERIIAAACAMDYPRDRLQIQVLDDSSDDCTEIVRECCEHFRAEGIDITCHHRDAREGFKSGALAAGLETATGELVAIFDADFVPTPDFLQRTVHHFTDEKIGVVQAEWRHLNRDESTLTRCQAMFLDGHFVVEQATRARTGRWFNFNGTAGLWRRSCIDQSGGWRHDTLTEDTDLSYRAQLDGWRFVYLPDVHADAELPSTMSAFLSQQHRWTRGLLQCAVKLMPRILFSKAPLSVKVEAWFHLTAPILYAVIFVLTALTIPATFVAVPLSELRGAPAWALGSAVLLGGTLAASVFVLIAQRAAGQSLWRTLVRLPALMALGVGMSAVNTRAVLGALLGVRSRFVRTPKFGGRSDSEADPDARRGLHGPPVGSVELMISGVLFACLFLGLSNDFALIGAPFLLLFAVGFLWVGGARFVESGYRVTVSTAVRFRALRWSTAAAVVAVTVVAVLGADSIWRTPLPETALARRVAGVDLTRAEWNVRGASVAGTEARLGGLALDVDLDPESGSREEGEIFIDLTGPLAPLGASLSDSQELVFDIVYPRNFSGELQAFVSDAMGKSQYGTIAFVERHDALRRLRVGIAPGSLTPAMGYTDPEFDAQRSIRRVGLKVSAQSDRVRGRGYRPFHGELTVAGVQVVQRGDSAPPEIRTVPADGIHRSQPVSPEVFLAASGLDRPWPLGYAFSGPISAEQRKTLDQTYAALDRHGLGFTRVYIGDYRTGLVFDAEGSVAGVEPQFLNFLDDLAETANSHGVTVMFSLMDNTLLDGKGVEFPQFVVDRKESDRFVARVLAPIVEKLAERRVIWDLFNEPENVTGAELLEVQDFVDRALAVLRRADADAKFTVVSRSAPELVYWRGRGLDVLSHNVFDQRGLDSAVNIPATTEVDAPVWIAEMAPELATPTSLEALRRAGYRGVGLWGWETGDKYDWSADDLERVVSPLVR
jgi:cellulose synthase/poly-beta-1,6-N-acetylglucosamine synthase-like glycosyltransferase/Leucine-rich repeat (LRR) protein